MNRSKRSESSRDDGTLRECLTHPNMHIVPSSSIHFFVQTPRECPTAPRAQRKSSGRDNAGEERGHSRHGRCVDDRIDDVDGKHRAQVQSEAFRRLQWGYFGVPARINGEGYPTQQSTCLQEAHETVWRDSARALPSPLLVDEEMFQVGP